MTTALLDLRTVLPGFFETLMEQLSMTAASAVDRKGDCQVGDISYPIF